MWRSLVVIALVGAGCMNPDEIFPLHGTVTSVDPVEGQVVRLLRRVQSLAQTSEGPCQSAQGQPFKETQTGPEGSYGFEVFRVEAQSLSGFDHFCFRIDTTFPSGSIAWTDLGVPASELTLAPLRDWRAAPGLDGGVLHFEPPVPWPDDLPPVLTDDQWHLGIQLTHRARVITADGGLVWQAEDRFQSADQDHHFVREPLVVDALRLEDFEGTLSLSASLFDPDQAPGGLGYFQPQPAIGMRAGEQLSVQGTRVPVSRGLACPELATPCPLTDGDLTPVDAGLITQLSLALPTPTLLSTVVLRGSSVGAGLIRVVLTQEDGGVALELARTVPDSALAAFDQGEPTFAPLRIADGGYVSLRLAYLVIPLDAGTPVARVTLQFPAGLAAIQEVSLFE